ncbi:DUF4129 domain-containing protein [Nocardia arthritidis]|uniref:DUF4129 domain-containing protein n=1 Tax=Nocardia arthritidis TaxID=228602 RepID=A0A6G9Y5L2_9NOCA|nr:DUF4129 domain-containing protein [Nocardia arthritidis]QIS08434.1 DUF4129 domain-containing protein [Nocardia arthritidis]
MAVARAALFRVIVLITLLAVATIALRGHIPGTGGSGNHPALPSTLAAALMPVLLTVSMVILAAGVIVGQHRLPLALPEIERRRRPGGIGLPLLGALIALGVAAALVAAVALIGIGTRSPETRSTAVPSPEPSTSETVSTATNSGEPSGLSGAPVLFVAVGAIGLIAVALIGLIAVAVSTRHHTDPAPPLEPEPAPTTMDSLTRAAEMGLAAVSAPGQDPRTAIIACYVAMERGLSIDRAAAPLVSDTPMEVLARAFERGALHDASARELVALFEEARFSPHAMLEWQRMRAEQLLRIVLADLQGEKV